MSKVELRTCVVLGVEPPTVKVTQGEDGTFVRTTRPNGRPERQNEIITKTVEGLKDGISNELTPLAVDEFGKV